MRLTTTEKLIIAFMWGIVIGMMCSCTTVKVTHQRPNLRRIEAQVFTDENNKLYIYLPNYKSDNFWKP